MSIFSQQKQKIAQYEDSLRKAKAEFEKIKTKRKIILGSYLEKLEENGELHLMNKNGLIEHLEKLKEKDKALFPNIFSKNEKKEDNQQNHIEEF